MAATRIIVLICLHAWSAEAFSVCPPPALTLRGSPTNPSHIRCIRQGKRRKLSPVMIFPGQSSEDDSADVGLIGFWQLINSTPDEESGVEKVVFRADNQVGGSPRFPEWEGAEVSWAGAQGAAGGAWKEYIAPSGQRRVEFSLLAPLKGAFERTTGERQAMFYDGVVLQMLEPGGKNMSEMRTSVRILGNMTSGFVGGDAAARVFRGKFSMVKMDTSNIELVPTVQPFARPFNTLARDAEEIAEERERDHDPAGMHKRVREEAERIQSREEEREGGVANNLQEQSSDDAAVQSEDGGRPFDGTAGGWGERTGETLAAELAKEVECQTRVESEMAKLREIMNTEIDLTDGSDGS